MKLFKNPITLLLLCAFPLFALEYTFGDGYQIDNSPFTIGGYASSNYAIEDHSRSFSVDDIAFLAYGEFDHFDFLAEVESSNFYKKEIGNSKDQSKPHFHIERLYGDYLLQEAQRFRLGKFNSDIGFWNQMPINVLRDTTSSPRLVEDFFPKLTTGINYEFKQASGLFHRLSLSAQKNNDLDPQYNNFKLNRHYSLAIDLQENDWLWRFSTGRFTYNQMQDASYLTASLKLEKKEWEALFESLLRDDENSDQLSYDVYAQGVWHWRSKHDLIVRAEIEKKPLQYDIDNSLTIGYTYRPLNNVALKGEYEEHHHAILNRWLFSFSVLF